MTRHRQHSLNVGFCCCHSHYSLEDVSHAAFPSYMKSSVVISWTFTESVVLEMVESATAFKD